MPPASGGGRVGAPFQAPIQCHSVAFNAIQCHSMAPFIALPPWIPGPGSSRANQPRNGARRNSSELNPATEGPKRSSKSWLGGGLAPTLRGTGKLQRQRWALRGPRDSGREGPTPQA